MKATGMIQVSVFTNALGVRERMEYRWVGPPCVEISSDAYAYRGPDQPRIQIGPYRLHLIEWHYERNSGLFVRTSYPFWWAFVAWHRMNRGADLAYRRIILTLAVWGLAEYASGRIPSWRDIKIVRRLRDWVWKRQGKPMLGGIALRGPG